jgi:hypothetical protein
LRLTLRPPLSNLGICLSYISLMSMNITCITNDGCWQFHVNCHRKKIITPFDGQHWPKRKSGTILQLNIFPGNFFCKQVLNWCLGIVEKNVSLAIVLELQTVQENDEVTYSTKVISRHKKKIGHLFCLTLFLALLQRNWISAGSKNN